MTALPRITILTPSLNQARFLEKAILSVLEQGYPHLEYVVMDGGSTDGSVDIIRRYADRLTYWQSQPDGGQSAAINAGFARSSGEIMGWLNSDDRLAPGALQTVAAFFNAHPDSDWCAGTGTVVDARGRQLGDTIPAGLDFETLAQWFDHFICQPSVFWRRSLWDRVGPLDERLHLAMDLDLWLRFARSGHGGVLPATLAFALDHSGAKSRRLQPDSFVETCLVLERHGAHEQAKARLLRVVRRAYEVDALLRPITRNPLYRRWRDKREGKAPG